MPSHTPIHRRRSHVAFLFMLLPAAVLVGCSTSPIMPPVADAPAPRQTPVAKSASAVPALPPAGSGRGGYYQDDGPGDKIPDGLLATPDAEPKIEPYATRGNRPYNVFGKTYVPILDSRPFKQRGIGSWYGKKFHGQKTSSGEPYDMYKMTAAHPTLPIPSYARVTNLANGTQIIVRINDRGPFHASRIIDLSYTAALKLGYLGRGSSELEVERLLPDDIARVSGNKLAQVTREPQAAASGTPAPATAAVATPVVMPTVAVKEPVRRKDSDAVAVVQVKDTAINPSAEASVSTATSPSTFALPVAAAVVEPSAPNAPAANGYYLQLGAYSQAASAETARGRLQQKWFSDLPPVEVVTNGNMHRLFSGPFASRAEAAAAAEKIRDTATVKPLIVQR